MMTYAHTINICLLCVLTWTPYSLKLVSGDGTLENNTYYLKVEVIESSAPSLENSNPTYESLGSIFQDDILSGEEESSSITISRSIVNTPLLSLSDDVTFNGDRSDITGRILANSTTKLPEVTVSDSGPTLTRVVRASGLSRKTNSILSTSSMITTPFEYSCIAPGIPSNVECILNEGVIDSDIDIQGPGCFLVNIASSEKIQQPYQVIDDHTILATVNTTEAGDYKLVCVAENDPSSICMKSLVIGYPPLDVTDLVCVSWNFQVLECNWSIPENPAQRPSDDYLLHLVTTFGRFECECDGGQGRCGGPSEGCRSTCCSWIVPQYSPVEKFFTLEISVANTLGSATFNHKFDNFASVIPNEVEKLELLPNSSSLDVEVQWDLPIYTSRMASKRGIRYAVEYRPEPSVYGTGLWQLGSTNICEDATCLTNVEVEHPGAKYEFRVRIRAERDNFTLQDDGWWSEWTPKDVDIPPQIPWSPPGASIGTFQIDRLNVASGFRNIKVSWSSVPILERNGPHFKYVISATIDGEPLQQTLVKETYITFNNISQDANLRVNISSANSIGHSEESSTVNVMPQKLMPDLPILPVVIYHNATQQFELIWNDDGDDNDSYTVYICTKKLDHKDPCKDNLVWQNVGNKTSVNITLEDFDLGNISNDDLSFALSRETSSAVIISSGMSWDQCYHPQDYQQSSAPPEFLGSIAATSASANVSWTLGCQDRGAVVEALMVEWCKGSHNSSGCSDLKRQNVTDIVSGHVVLTGLQAATKYSVRMRIRYRDNLSGWSTFKSFETSDISIPGMSLWLIFVIAAGCIIMAVSLVLCFSSCTVRVKKFWAIYEAPIKVPSGITDAVVKPENAQSSQDGTYGYSAFPNGALYDDQSRTPVVDSASVSEWKSKSQDESEEWRQSIDSPRMAIKPLLRPSSHSTPQDAQQSCETSFSFDKIPNGYVAVDAMAKVTMPSSNVEIDLHENQNTTDSCKTNSMGINDNTDHFDLFAEMGSPAPGYVSVLPSFDGQIRNHDNADSGMSEITKSKIVVDRIENSCQMNVSPGYTAIGAQDFVDVIESNDSNYKPQYTEYSCNENIDLQENQKATVFSITNDNVMNDNTDHLELLAEIGSPAPGYVSVIPSYNNQKGTNENTDSGISEILVSPPVRMVSDRIDYSCKLDVSPGFADEKMDSQEIQKGAYSYFTNDDDVKVNTDHLDLLAEIGSPAPGYVSVIPSYDNQKGTNKNTDSGISEILVSPPVRMASDRIEISCKLDVSPGFADVNSNDDKCESQNNDHQCDGKMDSQESQKGEYSYFTNDDDVKANTDHLDLLAEIGSPSPGYVSIVSSYDNQKVGHENAASVTSETLVSSPANMMIDRRENSCKLDISSGYTVIGAESFAKVNGGNGYEYKSQNTDYSFDIQPEKLSSNSENTNDKHTQQVCFKNNSLHIESKETESYSKPTAFQTTCLQTATSIGYVTLDNKAASDSTPETFNFTCPDLDFATKTIVNPIMNNSSSHTENSIEYQVKQTKENNQEDHTHAYVLQDNTPPGYVTINSGDTNDLPLNSFNKSCSDIGTIHEKDIKSISGDFEITHQNLQREAQKIEINDESEILKNLFAAKCLLLDNEKISTHDSFDTGREKYIEPVSVDKDQEDSLLIKRLYCDQCIQSNLGKNFSTLECTHFRNVQPEFLNQISRDSGYSDTHFLSQETYDFVDYPIPVHSSGKHSLQMDDLKMKSSDVEVIPLQSDAVFNRQRHCNRKEISLDRQMSLPPLGYSFVSGFSAGKVLINEVCKPVMHKTLESSDPIDTDKINFFTLMEQGTLAPLGKQVSLGCTENDSINLMNHFNDKSQETVIPPLTQVIQPTTAANQEAPLAIFRRISGNGASLVPDEFLCNSVDVGDVNQIFSDAYLINDKMFGSHDNYVHIKEEHKNHMSIHDGKFLKEFNSNAVPDEFLCDYVDIGKG